MTATFESRDLCRLISQALDGALSDGDAKRLESILVADVDARRLYYYAVAMHTQLAWELGETGPFAQMQLAEGNSRQPTGDIALPLAGDHQDSTGNAPGGRGGLSGRAHSWRQPLLAFLNEALGGLPGGEVAIGLLLLAVLVGAFSSLATLVLHSRAPHAGVTVAEPPLIRPGQPANGGIPPRPAFALWTPGVRCSWARRSSLGSPNGAAGSELHAGQELDLESGIGAIEFASSVRLTIEGPIRLTLVSGRLCDLRVGRLLASVPHGAAGFTVATPSSQVVDLGTEFGVEVTEGGRTEVQVTVGKVEVKHSAAASGATRVVMAGQAVRVTAKGSAIEPAAADARRFAALKSAKDLAEKAPPGYAPPAGPYVAYVVPAGTFGNQGYAGAMGMDFDVAMPTLVTRLGVFDSGSDGISEPDTLRVAIWSRDHRGTLAFPDDDRMKSKLAELEFSAANPGELVGGSRFLSLKEPLRLDRGSYTVMARGFSGKNLNGNVNTPDPPKNRWRTTVDNPCVLYVGRCRYGPTEVTAIHVDRFDVDQYAAGTFEFLAAPVKARPGAEQGPVIGFRFTLLGNIFLAFRRSY